MTVVTRNIILFAIVACTGTLSASAQLSFKGSANSIIEQKAEASTGLNSIYVIDNTQGVTATFTSKSGNRVQWYKYGNLGGGHAEEIASTVNGPNSTVTLTGEDTGFIIEDGTDRYYYWVVNYANHRARFESLTFASEQECDRTRLTFTGEASRINYFTINGASRTLDRELHIDYHTLKYNEGSETYDQVPASQTFEYIDQSVGVFAPLCDTHFVLTGDRFLRTWGEEEMIETESFTAIAVEAQTSAIQDIREADNEQKIEANLGGSAPVDIHFRAAVTDAAIFREWQMTKDQTFEVIDDRIQQLDFDHTFRENGNTYIRFVANNATGTCEYVGETYEIFVGESDLLCPNAFSPNGDGVNDEWKVSYKSIVEFECHIFNRWGQEMISLTDPSQGWDGKYHGKTVPTGVYYYVIKAKGADGRKYHRNGDINVIKSSRTTTSVSPEE